MRELGVCVVRGEWFDNIQWGLEPFIQSLVYRRVVSTVWRVGRVHVESTTTTAAAADASMIDLDWDWETSTDIGMAARQTKKFVVLRRKEGGKQAMREIETRSSWNKQEVGKLGGLDAPLALSS